MNNNNVKNIPHISIGNNGEKILNPFGPMIHQSYLSDDEVSLFLQESENTPMKEEDYNFKLFKKSFIEKTSPIIMSRVYNFMDNVSNIFQMALPSKDSLIINSMWANYQQQHDTVPVHSHFCFLQFVIYCQVPQRIFEETGRHNPLLPGRTEFTYGEEITPLSKQSYLLTPEKNMMIIFPGKLHHQVYPFYSEDVRISVAGSIITNHQI
jgi:hypothetical protein